MVLWSGILVCTEFKCIVKFLFDILLYCGLRRHPVGWVDSRFLSWLWRRSVTRLHCVFCVVSSTNCISISHYMVWALLNKEFDRIWNEGLWQHFRKGAEQNHPPPPVSALRRVHMTAQGGTAQCRTQCRITNCYWARILFDILRFPLLIIVPQSSMLMSTSPEQAAQYQNLSY
jgi:hypothetical protein